MKVKQINSQSDLIWMSSFAGPSYLTIRSSVYIILIWDLYIFNLYNLWQTWCNYMRWKPTQYALHLNERITRTHFFLLHPSIRPVPAQVIYCGKGRQNFASNVTLYPCKRSRQNHLGLQNLMKEHEFETKHFLYSTGLQQKQLFTVQKHAIQGITRFSYYEIWKILV